MTQALRQISWDPRPAGFDAVPAPPYDHAAPRAEGWQLPPVLPRTFLFLELLSQQPALDLRSFAEALRRDPGAVLRLFARIGVEIPRPSDRPERLEDCIAMLGVRTLLETMYAPPSAREEQARLAPFAEHGFLIAHQARLAATSLGLGKEQAFLAGLLHEMDRLPTVLGRVPPVQAWLLPPGLGQILWAVQRGEPGSVWVALIQAAHDLAERSQEAAR